MAEGRARLAWSLTAEVLCMLYWAHKSPDAEGKKPADFDPYQKRDKERRERRAVCDIDILRTVFIEGKRPSARGET